VAALPGDLGERPEAGHEGPPFIATDEELEGLHFLSAARRGDRAVVKDERTHGGNQ
jgi:hypothetical protein